MNRKPVKPLVFMSHSSKDSEALIALEALLEERSAGMIDFFLACDGQSLRFGENWVAGVSDALAKANLMFVFLSEHSVDSHWVWFETGHASGKDIRVVPVGLPGTEISKVGAPISFRQGFNLHSHAALTNLARVCNEVCEAKIKEDFTPDDFQKVFGAAGPLTGTYFGPWTAAIDTLSLESKVKITKDAPWHPVADLLASFQEHSPEVPAETKQAGERGDHTLHGKGISAGQRVYNQSSPGEGYDCQLSIQLVPELLHLYAPAMDKWFQATKPPPLATTIKFTTAVKMISNRQRLTAKLYDSSIVTSSHDKLKYGDVAFKLDSVGYGGSVFAFGGLGQGPIGQQPTLTFDYEGNFGCIPLREIIAILFQRGVFTWER